MKLSNLFTKIDFVKISLLSTFFLILISTQSQAASTWNVSLDESNGLPKLSKGGGDAISASFLFFDKKMCIRDRRRVSGEVAR